MEYTYQSLIIVISLLFVIGILAYNPAKFLGIPSLIIFMGIGLLIGNGYWGSPVYDNPKLTSIVSSLALNVIIFIGGYRSPIEKIKKAYKEGLALATIGVLLTALILGYLTYLLTDLPIITAILFGAIVSSTDAASVFSILESKKLQLKERTDTVLEFESATNDPMAFVLVMIFTSLALQSGEEIRISSYVLEFFKQLFIGGVVGGSMGYLLIWIFRKMTFKEEGLIPLMIISLFLITTFGSEMLGGNLLITSYLFGLIVGNAKLQAKELTSTFLYSSSWIAQVIMYLLLGIQVFPERIIEVFWISLLPSLLLILIARPVSVFLSYLPFRKVSLKKKMFISAIGLKGATPIVFGFIPLLAGVEGAQRIFHMVFFIVISSILIQGSLLTPLAKRLDLME